MLYARAARPVLAFADQIGELREADATKLVHRAAELLDRFDAELVEGGAPRAAVPTARCALGLVIDHRARANRALSVKLWAAAAGRLLFDGREMSEARLRDFIGRARSAGPEYAGLEELLAECLARVSDHRSRTLRHRRSTWGRTTAGLAGLFVLMVAGWAGHVEWRFHADLRAAFAQEVAQIGLAEVPPTGDLAARLEAMADAVRRVDLAAARSPIELFAEPLRFDARRHAQDSYDAALARHLPQAIVAALDLALATEGDGLDLYDTLRARAILGGTADFNSYWIAGWLEDRAAHMPEARGLAGHAARMQQPPAGAIPVPEPELLAQAQEFASEVPEADLAFLELRRSQGVARLPAFLPAEAVPGLETVLMRRSGLPLEAPLPGLYTAAGWDHARDIGAGLAVQSARAEAARLLPVAPPRHNGTPDRVLDLLQARTLAEWRNWLSDLRVRPFSDAAASVLISGRLSVRNSPLESLMRQVWAEVGGHDRRRSHPQQLRMATEFGPMIQYVERGRMEEISALFATLNVALGAMDRDEETGLQRLMSVQNRAASISALNQAPLVVVQIVEDVLAQTGAAHADLLTNPVTRQWQTEVLPLCRQVANGAFPFADGPDADLDALAALLAPGGVIPRFFASHAEPYIDTTTAPWRWRPEARFGGLDPESAIFFQRAAAISSGFFDPDGTLGASMQLSALAERGQATIAIGGAAAPVQVADDDHVLRWPGPSPERGLEVTFRQSSGEARLVSDGPWGMFRVLSGLRLRERDEGQRFMIDLREGGARLYFKMVFERPDNPLSRFALLRGFQCPVTL